MGKYDELKMSAYKANMQLPELGLVLFTFGNVSVFDKSFQVFAIKPSGVPYKELSPENMVVVDLNANVVVGKLRPSSDTKTHAVLYQQWNEIGSIVHTHSTYATAWAQANYSIESTVVQVDSPWISGVNTTSNYCIKTGGVFLLSTTAGAPFSSFQYYNVLTDTWTSKTALGGNLLTTLGTDYDFEIITRIVPYETGTTTSATSRTIIDNTKNMIVNQYINYNIKLTSGSGASDENRIVANGTNYFELARPWRVIPSVSSSYEIQPGVNKMFLLAICLIAFFILGFCSGSFSHISPNFTYIVSLLKSLQWTGLS
jgi:hypothetical protein